MKESECYRERENVEQMERGKENTGVRRKERREDRKLYGGGWIKFSHETQKSVKKMSVFSP